MPYPKANIMKGFMGLNDEVIKFIKSNNIDVIVARREGIETNKMGEEEYVFYGYELYDTALNLLHTSDLLYPIIK